MTSTTVLIHIWLLIFFPCKLFKSWEEVLGRYGLRKMWFIGQPGSRLSDVKIFQGHHMIWWKMVILIICVGFEVLIFRTWECNIWRLTWWFCKSIFSNAINNFWCDNLIGTVHALVPIGHLDHMCWFSKYWWVVLGRVGFGCWLGDFDIPYSSTSSLLTTCFTWGGQNFSQMM